MKDNIKVMIYFTIFVLFMAFAYIGYGFLAKEQTNKVNEDLVYENQNKKTKLKNFEVYNENNEKLSIKKIANSRPMVINVWTSWCAYCDIEMKYFNELYMKNSKDVVFVMLNATGDRDSKEMAKKYIEDRGYNFNVYYDLELEAIKNLGIYSYPTTIFVNKDGYIENTIVGTITKEVLQANLERLK